MPVIDTILGYKANPGTSSFATVTMSGDNSNVVRSFPDTSKARLEGIIRAGTTAGGVRITSPMLHDDTRGITVISPETPAVFMMPQEIGQPLTSNDPLTIAVTGGTNETDIVALQIYYEQVGGLLARLYMPSDVFPYIDQYKPVEVDITNSGTAGLWTDTLITTTENIMRAKDDYAVLGYITDTAIGLVGLKGTATGNLRIAGPGTTATEDTSHYFVERSLREGTPHVPVINGADVNAIWVSTADSAASSTAKVQLLLGHLSRTLG